jgi:hypothetical protein
LLTDAETGDLPPARRSNPGAHPQTASARRKLLGRFIAEFAAPNTLPGVVVPIDGGFAAFSGV